MISILLNLINIFRFNLPDLMDGVMGGSTEAATTTSLTTTLRLVDPICIFTNQKLLLLSKFW